MKKVEDKHILVVEDSQNDALLYSHVIENILKLKATTVGDGRQAVNMARLSQYDLVLLDMNLPSLTGNLVALKLRGLKNYESVPIIAITAYDHAAVRQSSLGSGCDIFLTKPVDIDILAEIIQLYLLRPRPKSLT